MTLSPGQRLGPYEILSALGAGGMGEVYKARDGRLRRVLAIKVLPAEFTAHPERLRRFEREARAASGLNHPAIVTVYDVGTADSIPYIAMEHVEGQTLGELLRGGPLPVRRLLGIAAAVADGLASAHEAGIVHRDLKPANLMVAREGFVKILDFGLAKLTPTGARRSDADSTESAPWIIVGSVAYMSPEQARGDPVDFRSDHFSLGSILYEMATGRRPFRGETDVDTLAAILRMEPEPIGQIDPSVPAPLRWLIERCHAKAPADRYTSTRDLARELGSIRDHLGEISSGQRPAARTRRSRSPLLAGLAIGLSALAAAVWWVPAGGRGRPLPDVDFRRLTQREGAVYRALFVPHSNAILYTASWDGKSARSYLTLPEAKGVDRSLDAEVQLPLAYTEDGSEVLVLLGRSRPALNPVGRLAWWPALGGKPRVILEEAGWSDLAPRARFLAVVREEGTERALEVLDPQGVRQRTLFRTTGAISYVRVSPDEKHVAFIHHPSRIDDAGEVRVADLKGSASWAVSRRFVRCVGLDWNPRTGEIWFTATQDNIYRTTLWAARLSGEPRPLYAFPDFFLLQDVSERGCLFLSSSGGTSLFLGGPVGTPRDYTWLGSTFVTDVSPDGESVLFTDGGPTEPSYGTWVRPLDGGDAVRIADGDAGRFSADGKWVVTTSRLASGPPQLALVPAGGGQGRQITSDAAVHSEPAFVGSDGLLYVRSEGDRTEVWRMATDGSGARSLGVSDCFLPDADPSGAAFLCLGGTQRNVLFLYPLQGGPGRKLHELQSPAWFVYARWHGSGKQIFAVTSDGRLLTLDAASAALLHTEALAFPEGFGSGSLLSAAFSRDATIRAYSLNHFSSRLYVSRGL